MSEAHGERRHQQRPRGEIEETRHRRGKEAQAEHARENTKQVNTALRKPRWTQYVRLVFLGCTNTSRSWHALTENSMLNWGFVWFNIHSSISLYSFSLSQIKIYVTYNLRKRTYYVENGSIYHIKRIICCNF